MTMVELKMKGGRVPAARAFYDCLVTIAETWPLLDEHEQEVCGKAIRQAFAPFFHEKLVDNLRGALDVLIEKQRDAIASEPAQVLRVRDASGRMTTVVRTTVTRDVAERVAAHNET